MITVTLSQNRSLHIHTKPLVMGILNATPDSFYSGSRIEAGPDAVERARRMIADGADLLDVGGESSRPGSDYVDADEEISRVVPVIRAIRAFSDIPISIDTRKLAVAREAVAAGADMINDISALRDDPGLASFAADRGIPVVLMHMRGTPRTMQQNPHYNDVVTEVLAELAAMVDMAMAAGIARDRIIIDPGIGFGKRMQDNVALLRAIDRFTATGLPVLIGASRKTFIGALIAADGEQPRPPEERLAGTLAVHLHAATAGAHILRVHDVAETVHALRVSAALLPDRAAVQPSAGGAA
ncbi:MAG: dihydropteroate synthase [Spirochaetaceae bacterium]|nr:MAG: dihydropteroate synthase [Spirochaetaceae bacterium]